MVNNYLVGKGDVRLISLHTNAGNVIDMTKMVGSISYYEDILTHGICGDLQVFDGTNLQAVSQLTGGEILAFDVGERGTAARKLKSNFTISSLHNRIYDKKDLDVYGLSLMTPEMVLDASSQVWKAYKKPVHEIVKNVVEEYITPITGKKLIETEETLGIHAIVGNGVTPFGFIKQLCREAESINYPSSIFLFYERAEGYCFHTLDYLYAQTTSHRIFHDLVYLSQADGNNFQQQQNYITDIHYETGGFDIMQPGQYNNKTMAFDPLRKTMQTTTYTYDQEKKTTSEEAKKLLSKPSMVSYVMTDSLRNSSPYITDNQVSRRRQNFVGKEKAIMAQYAAMKLKVAIPGNSNIYAGQTIDVVIPSKEDTSSGKMHNDEFYSGKWLVSSLAHKIMATTNDYHTVLELMRPTYNRKIK